MSGAGLVCIAHTLLPLPHILIPENVVTRGGRHRVFFPYALLCRLWYLNFSRAASNRPPCMISLRIRSSAWSIS